MNAKEFLNTVCEEIKYKPASKQISEELEGHIQDIKTDYLCKGYTEQEAEEKAVEEMGDAKKIGKRLNKIHRPKLDWKIMLLIIMLIGVRIVIDVTTFIRNKQHYDSQYTFGNMILWNVVPVFKNMIICILLGAIIYFFDYRKSKKWASRFYLIATGILLFQWIDMMFLDKLIHLIFDNQTMWFVNMKLWYAAVPFYIISFAGYIADYQKEDFWDIVILYAISFIAFYFTAESIMNTIILILAYLAIIATKMLQLNKESKKKIIAICSGVLGASIVIMIVLTNIRIPYVFYGYTAESSWNHPLTQDKQADILENAKLMGEADAETRGWTNFLFLDIIGRFGIIPALGVVAIIILMSIRLIKDAKNIQDLYGKYLIIGLSVTYIAQSIIHVLMNVNILPLSDVNLPFVSNGDMYFLINSFTFAVILSVYRRKNINFETGKNIEKAPN